MSDDATTTDEPSEAATAPNAGRRSFLSKGTIAAAAAAVGVVALSDAAEAADGATLTVNGIMTGSTATSNTRLNSSSLTVNTAGNAYAIKGIHRTTGVHGVGGASGVSGVGIRGDIVEGGTGVYGTSFSTSAPGVGVKGQSSASIGVYGEGGGTSIAGVGVQGKSPLGPQLHLEPGTRTATPPSGSWSAGSFLVTTNGHVNYCYKSGTGAAAGWVKLSGAPVILATGYRAYDSRPGEAPLGVTKGKIGNGETRSNIDLKVNGGVNAIPTGISAVILNVVANQTDAAGFFGLFKNGTTWPGTSTVNWGATNSSIANTTIVPCDTTSRIAIRGAGSSHCIIDVIGYLP